MRKLFSLALIVSLLLAFALPVWSQGRGKDVHARNLYVWRSFQSVVDVTIIGASVIVSSQIAQAFKAEYNITEQQGAWVHGVKVELTRAADIQPSTGCWFGGQFVLNAGSAGYTALDKPAYALQAIFKGSDTSPNGTDIHVARFETQSNANVSDIVYITANSGTTMQGSGLYIANHGTMPNAIQINGAGGTLTNGIDMLGTIASYGIDLGSATIGTADVVLSNSELIDNTTDGLVLITAPTLAASNDFGVGTTSPDGQLEISKDSANATSYISAYHDTETTTPLLTLRKADGSEALPTAVDQGAILGTIDFDGYDDNSFDDGARVYAKADANWGSSERGTELYFSTRDGAGGLTDQFKVTAGGDFEGVTSKWWFCHYIDMLEASPGASGATWTAPGANTIGGYQLDAAGEYLYFSVRVCPNWDAASDLRMGISFEVNVDNTGGADSDTVDLQLLCYYKGEGDTASKTQTLEEATIVGKSPQYKTFQALFTIDYNPGGGNDIEIYDVMSFRLNLETDTSEVDNVIINFSAFAFKTAEGFIQISEAP